MYLTPQEISDFNGIRFPVIEDQFKYLGANRASITTTSTNPYGVSPYLSPYGMYTFEYWLGLSNSSTGAVSLGWTQTSAPTIFTSEVLVLPTTDGTAFGGVHRFVSTTSKTMTGLSSATTHWIKIDGFIVNGATNQRLPLVVSVASGNITPLRGSWFRFIYRGESSFGTSDMNIGSIA